MTKDTETNLPIRDTFIAGNAIQLYEHPKVWMPTRFGEALGEIIVASGVSEQKVLELGVGSGVLSILAGKLGAEVTALDINHDALKVTKENWSLNGLPIDKLDVRHSDLFSGMSDADKATYNLLFSNPPTFPGNPSVDFRLTRDDWELAGEDGRIVLDAAIAGSQDYLVSGGKMITIATSKQSWILTYTLMEKYWTNWTVLKSEDVKLAPFYSEFIPLWLEKERQDGEPRIYTNDNGQTWYQKLYFIEGVKQ